VNRHLDRAYSRNLLTLIKFDAEDLYERVVGRFEEYMDIFSMKRTREHFKEIFKQRFDKVNMQDLALMDHKIVEEAHSFYKKVEELHWYLYSTEDLPATAKDYVWSKVKILKKIYVKLSDEIQREITHLDEEPAQIQEVESQSSNGDFPVEEFQSFEQQSFSSDTQISIEQEDSKEKEQSLDSFKLPEFKWDDEPPDFDFDIEKK